MEIQTISIAQFLAKFLDSSIDLGELEIAGRFFNDRDAFKCWIQNGTTRIFFKINENKFLSARWVALRISLDQIRHEKNGWYNDFYVGEPKKIEALEFGDPQNIKFSTFQEASLNSGRSSSSILRTHVSELSKWSDFLSVIREFFLKRKLVEATTPSLVVNPGMEPELEPFHTIWKVGSNQTSYFLPTSPELGLKKLISYGFTDIFEIKTVFRNEESTPQHEPEFTMLEWYRSFTDLNQLQFEFTDLLNHLGYQVFLKEDLFRNVRVYSVAHFFKELLNKELTPKTTREQLLNWAIEADLKPDCNWDFNDLFNLIWVSKIENHLPLTAFFLCDYPPSQAALAKINSRGWADRMEFYWQGMEIANGFNELTDPLEQRTRFKRDQILRIKNGRTPLEIDEDFMDALNFGIPQTSGIAVGLDRLFKCFVKECCR